MASAQCAIRLQATATVLPSSCVEGRAAHRVPSSSSSSSPDHQRHQHQHPAELASWPPRVRVAVTAAPCCLLRHHRLLAVALRTPSDRPPSAQSRTHHAVERLLAAAWHRQLAAVVRQGAATACVALKHHHSPRPRWKRLRSASALQRCDQTLSLAASAAARPRNDTKGDLLAGSQECRPRAVPRRPEAAWAQHRRVSTNRQHALLSVRQA